MMRVRALLMVLVMAACAPRASYAQEGDAASPPTPATTTSPHEAERTYRTTCEAGGRDLVCEVRMTISKTAATVADRIEFVLEARVPEGVTVRWPKIEKTFGGLDVLGVEDAEPVVIGQSDAASKRQLVRRVVLLEPFLPGDREIPQLEVQFTGAGPCRIVTEPVKIEVASLIEGEPQEPELRGIVEPEPENESLYWVVVIVPPVIAMTALVALAIRRTRGRRHEEVLSPYAAAMRRLTQLDESGLLAQSSTSEYGAVLGETLREYVSGAMGMPAADRTTEQLLTELGSQPSINVASLQDLLQRLDEVSFAGDAVGMGEAQELRDRVQKMILGIQAMRTAAAADAAKESER